MTEERSIIPESERRRMTDGRVVYGLTVRLERGDCHWQISMDTTMTSNVHLQIAELVFIQCEFFAEVKLGNYQCAGPISFESCVFHENVTILSKPNIKLGQGNRFRKDLTIGDMETEQRLVGFQVDGCLSILGGQLDLHISNINDLPPTGKLIVRTFVKQLMVEASNFDEIEIALFGDAVLSGRKAGTAYLVASQCRLFTLVGNVEDLHLLLLSSKLGSVDLETLQDARFVVHVVDCLEVGNFKISMQYLQELTIANSKIGLMQLQGRNKKGDSVLIGNTVIHALEFDNVINEGLVAFRGLEIPAGGRLAIRASNLGQTEFIHSQLGLAVLEFENSRMSEVFLADTDFPKLVNGKAGADHRQARLAFGQLWKAFDRQGDTVRALEYQSREIEAHYVDIGWMNATRRFPWLNFTKLNLFLNKWSNNFGRDWGRGVLFSLIVGMICFALLVLLGTKEYSFCGSWRLDPRLFGSFIRFMNPLRFFDLDSLFTSGREQIATICTRAYLLDFIARVGLAYGYYQTIQAFRRFGRR